mmetsp:Transcript_59923/g.120296  ORF Transcript_59923/g.120296 Transcript_59923/m.120296 type:complete len:128 (+) Transcript_59923:588-971(+)
MVHGYLLAMLQQIASLMKYKASDALRSCEAKLRRDNALPAAVKKLQAMKREGQSTEGLERMVMWRFIGKRAHLMDSLIHSYILHAYNNSLCFVIVIIGNFSYPNNDCHNNNANDNGGGGDGDPGGDR